MKTRRPSERGAKRAPDGVDLAFHLRDQQYRGDDDEDDADAFEFRRLGDELVEVMADGNAAAGQEEPKQKRFQRFLETVEQREARYVARRPP